MNPSGAPPPQGPGAAASNAPQTDASTAPSAASVSASSAQQAAPQSQQQQLLASTAATGSVAAISVPSSSSTSSASVAAAAPAPAPTSLTSTVSSTNITSQAAVQPSQPNTSSSAVQNVAQAHSDDIDEQQQQEQLFVRCETEYQETMSLIQNDDGLAKFRTEYEKMHKALLRSRHHAMVLYKQYEEVNSEHVTNLTLGQEAAKNSLQDEVNLKNLKAQIKKAEDTTENCAKREETLKEELHQIRVEIQTLTANVRQGVGLSSAQERALNELIAAKDAASRELENELDRIVHLRNTIGEVTEKIKQTDQLKRDREHEIYDLKERNAAKKADIDVELRNKERLERDLRELRVVVAVKSQEVRGKQEVVNRATDDIGILETQIRSQKQMLEKLFKDQESLQTRTIKLQQDCNEQITSTTLLIEENEQLAKDLHNKEADLLKTKGEVKKVNRIRDALAKKNRTLEDQRVEVEHERRSLRQQNETTLNQIDRMKRSIDMTKKAIDDLQRERDILQMNVMKTTQENTRHEHASLLFKQTRHNLEVELGRETRLHAEQLELVEQLKKERDECAAEASRVQALCIAGLQEIKEKELEIFEFKKKMIQADTKLKHQQNLYEAVQSDRNLHSKHLIESQAEIAEMKRRLKIMNFQINGYKEDINSKDEAMEKETTENAKLEKDLEIINEEVKTLKNQSELAQAYIRSQLAEEMKLNQFVKEADLERTRQENALRVLISERDNLSSQLIRQNEELSKAYNQIKTQQSSLTRSELYYQERLKVMNSVRKEIADLRDQNLALQQETMDLESSKRAILRVHSDIIRERTRKKALEDELENPINVHRWRKLEGSNPKAFEMIQLLHTLQRSLIEKTKEDQEKERLIQSREQLYLHLKGLLSKQVGPEAIEQVDEFRQILKDKNAQLRHMAVELNMYQTQVREYRHSIDVQNRALQQIKDGYFEMKRQGGGRASNYTHSAASKSPVNQDQLGSQRLAPSAEPSNLPPLPNGPIVSSKQGLADVEQLDDGEHYAGEEDDDAVQEQVIDGVVEGAGNEVVINL